MLPELGARSIAITPAYHRVRNQVTMAHVAPSSLALRPISGVALAPAAISLLRPQVRSRRARDRCTFRALVSELVSEAQIPCSAGNIQGIFGIRAQMGPRTNPSPSSGESDTNLTSSIRAPKISCRQSWLTCRWLGQFGQSVQFIRRVEGRAAVDNSAGSMRPPS